MSMSGFAGGASDGLFEALKQRFLEMEVRKRLMQADRSLDLQESRDNVNAEVSHGQLKVAGDNVGIRRDEHGQRVREYDEGKAGAAAQAAEFDQFASQLPQHMRPVAIGKMKFGVNMTPEDLVQAPQTREDAQAFRIKGIAGETEARERIQAKYRPAPQPKDERLVQVEGPDGSTIWVKESDAVGKRAAQPARSVTGAERQSIAYFNRAKESDELANQFEERVAGAGVGSQLQQQYAPNILQTSDQQSYRQAQRAFTEARLRKESGAAIPQGEYENDARTYFAQPGDSPEVRAQKRQARKTVLEGLKFSSGRAYDEFYGSQGKDQPGKGGSSAVDELLKKYGG